MGLNHRGSIDGLVASVVEAEEAAEEAAEEVEVVEDHLPEAMVVEEDPSHQRCQLPLHPHHLEVVVVVAVVVVVEAVDSHLARNPGHHLGRGHLLLSFLLLLRKVLFPFPFLRGSCLMDMSHMFPFPKPDGFSHRRLYTER
jgi:hypothetical protein